MIAAAPELADSAGIWVACWSSWMEARSCGMKKLDGKSVSSTNVYRS